MFRILHTADWHRGAPNAHPVFQKQMIPTLVKFALKNKCRYVLVAGDVFDRPNPDQRVKDQLVRQLSKFVDEDVVFIFAVGNHDYTTKTHTYHSLNYMHIIKKLIGKLAPGRELVHVVEPGQFLELPDFVLCALPEFAKVPVPTSALALGRDKPLVFTWHGPVPGLTYTDPKRIPEQTVELANTIRHAYGAKYIALGDIHRCLKVAPYCWYSGPPAQKAYDDEDGVLVVTFDDKVTVAKSRLDLPKKINVAMSFEEGSDTEKSLVDYVREKLPAGNLIRLKFELPLSVWSSLNKQYIKDELEETFLEVVLDNNPVPERRTRKALSKMAAANSLEEELAIIIKEESFGLDEKKLAEVCHRYL